MLSIVFVFGACENDTSVPTAAYPDLMEIPDGFPDMEVPQDNAFNHERWQLGKRLFFDKALSMDSTVSCASCHLPELAFSDNRPTSPGVAGRPGTRNAPSLANVGYHPYFTREGGVPTLEMQVLVPVQEHNEFDFNIVLLAERLLADSAYAQESIRAYGRPMDPFVITRALACFERSLISGGSRYDAYAFQQQEDALSAEEKAGMALFFSDRTNCSQCHSGANFTDYSIRNNGLYKNYADIGRARLTGDSSDIGRFKVPSLRNAALTAPYMHDGSVQSLREVVAHYNSGGSGHFNQDSLIHRLDLTEVEQSRLVAFLESLNDEQFIENPLFQKDD